MRFAARLPDLLLLTGWEAFFDAEFYGLGAYNLAAGIKQILNMHCQIWSYIKILAKDIARNIAGKKLSNDMEGKKYVSYINLQELLSCFL